MHCWCQLIHAMPNSIIIVIAVIILHAGPWPVGNRHTRTRRLRYEVVDEMDCAVCAGHGATNFPALLVPWLAVGFATLAANCQPHNKTSRQAVPSPQARETPTKNTNEQAGSSRRRLASNHAFAGVRLQWCGFGVHAEHLRT